MKIGYYYINSIFWRLLMICSVCKKNVAIILINKIDGDKKVTEGLCYNCANERGLNPLEALAKQANLTDENINDITFRKRVIFVKNLYCFFQKKS